MRNFTYHTPTEIVFGKEAENNTADLVKKYGGKTVMIVYGGGSVVKSGLLAGIESLLSQAGMNAVKLGGVQPNPRLQLARDGVKLAIGSGVDFVLAVGGGSVIDTAKAIAHGTANPGIDIWDFWLGKAKLEKSLPIGAVLTIPAAGSEMSDSSVLTDAATGVKKGFSTPMNRPCFAVMNPVLTFTLPKRQVACGIVDIMMHTLDRYFTKVRGNELTDAIAEAVLKTTIESGKQAIKDSEDYESMSELMWCGSLSHNGLTGLGRNKDFVPHKLGHELSGKFDVAHGESLSAIWGSWARYVYKEDMARFAQYAARVWGIQNDDKAEAALAGITATENYFRLLSMPTSFMELGIGIQSEDVLRDLAARCSGNGEYTVGDFKKIGQLEAYEIFAAANC